MPEDMENSNPEILIGGNAHLIKIYKRRLLVERERKTKISLNEETKK